METNEIRREFRDVLASIDALTQGLALLREGLDTQTEMLKLILEAATREPEPSPLAKKLDGLIKSMNAQTEVLVRFGETVNNVGPEIERAVIRGINRAVGSVNENGEATD